VCIETIQPLRRLELAHQFTSSVCEYVQSMLTRETFDAWDVALQLMARELGAKRRRRA
jgi:hypothetical protein